MAKNTGYDWKYDLFPVDEEGHFEYLITRTCSICKSEITYNSDLQRVDKFVFDMENAKELAEAFILNMKMETETFTDEHFGTCDCREDK